MSRTVTIDGESYTLPTGSDKNWLAEFNRLLLALVDAVNEEAEVPTPGVSILSFGAASIPAVDSVSHYLIPWSENDAAESAARHILIPQAGTLSRVFVRADGGAAHDAPCEFAIIKAGGGSIAVPLLAATQTANDTVATLAVSAGDRIYCSATWTNEPLSPPSEPISRPLVSLVFTPS